MTSSILTLLIILAIAIVLFSFEWVSVDIIALGLLLALILTNLLPVGEAFAGFGSDTAMMILGLLILTAALGRSGASEAIGRAILRRTGDHPTRLLIIVLLAAVILSSFMSNTASTALLLPVVISIGTRLKVNSSRLLMPLAFGTILASSVTLIGTSTNIVVSGLMTKYGMQPLGMFELTPVGLPIALIGLLYMLFFGRRLVPDRQGPADLADQFNLRPFLTEAVVQPRSSLIGKTLGETGLGRDLDLTVLWVERQNERLYPPHADIHLLEGDLLLLEGSKEEIIRLKQLTGITLKAEAELSGFDLQTEDIRLAEVVLLLRSPLIGRSLRSMRFRERYGLQVLAIHRREATIYRKLSTVQLRLGDVLLVQGPRANLRVLEEEQAFQVMSSTTPVQHSQARILLMTTIFVAAIAVAGFEILPVPVAVLSGALLAFLTRSITPEEAYRSIEWKVLIVIGCMLALGSAMESTGTATYLASQIVAWIGQVHPIWMLSIFFFMTVLFTQPMSNQAAAVLVVPVAIQTGLQMGLDPRPFAVIVAVAASTSYLTPLEPACLMVYSPGRYRFMDFFKVGALLTVLIYLVSIWLVPMIWPFT